MQNVIFTDKRGRERVMHERYAELLQKLGRGTYMNRALVAEAPEYVDAAGVLWSADMHTSSRLKNQDGTWRKKPGKAKE